MLALLLFNLVILARPTEVSHSVVVVRQGPKTRVQTILQLVHQAAVDVSRVSTTVYLFQILVT